MEVSIKPTFHHNHSLINELRKQNYGDRKALGSDCVKFTLRFFLKNSNYLGIRKNMTYEVLCRCLKQRIL